MTTETRPLNERLAEALRLREQEQPDPRPWPRGRAYKHLVYDNPFYRAAHALLPELAREYENAVRFHTNEHRDRVAAETELTAAKAENQRLTEECESSWQQGWADCVNEYVIDEDATRTQTARMLTEERDQARRELEECRAECESLKEELKLAEQVGVEAGILDIEECSYYTVADQVRRELREDPEK